MSDSDRMFWAYKFQSNHETRGLTTISTISINSERNVSLQHFMVVLPSPVKAGMGIKKLKLKFRSQHAKIFSYEDHKIFWSQLDKIRETGWQSNSDAQFTKLKNCIWTSLVFCDLMIQIWMLRGLTPEVASSGRTTLLQCRRVDCGDHHGPHFTQVDRLTAELTLVTWAGAGQQTFLFLT